MGVELDVRALGQHSAGLNDGFENGGRYRRARRVLETDRVEGDVGVEDGAQGLGVERGVVRPYASRRQGHHGHADLVFESGLDDTPARVHQVLHIVEGVEVADRRNPVFGEQLGVQPDDVTRLRVEADDVHAARQRLQIRLRTGSCPETVHHRESVLSTVEVERLEAGAAAGFEVVDPGIPCRFEGGQEVGRQNARSVDGLKAVAERGAHEVDLLRHNFLVI